jgi:hypothetical protein
MKFILIFESIKKAAMAVNRLISGKGCGGEVVVMHTPRWDDLPATPYRRHEMAGDGNVCRH